MVLWHELELEGAFVGAGRRFEERLMWVGDDDRPEQAGIGGLIQRPVEHRPQRYRQDFLGEPASDRVEPRAAAAAGDDGGVQRHASILHAMPVEPSPRPKSEQGRAGWTIADLLSAVRIPLAIAFPLVSNDVRLALLGAAAGSDLLDGPIARRFGASRLGVVLDPVADKLFMASAFGVVAASGRLEWYEILGVLLRDLVATIAFVVTYLSHRPRAIPARAGGKAVTVAQVLTLLAFLAESPHLWPLAWATTAIALYAIWDYYRVAPAAERRLGGDTEP